MKRVIAACLSQTLHFQIKPELDRDEAVRIVRAEVAHYKAGLERKRTLFVIDSEVEQPDGSVIMKVRKQNLSTPVGEYLD